MIRIVLENGDEFTAETYGALVRYLADAYPRGESKREYMNATARSVRIWDASEIATDNPEVFIRELYRVGVIVELTEE